jgi:hypothetical protein
MKTSLLRLQMPPNKSLERTRGGYSAKLIRRRARRSTQPLGGRRLLRQVVQLACFFTLAGCVPLGPRHGVIIVTGKVPVGASGCSVAVATVGDTSEPRLVPVAGNFRTEVVINPSRRGHRAILACGGSVVAERKFKYGLDVDIGGEVSLDGPAT